MTNTPKKPRIGIFMPAYNQGPYISEAIESLEKQTFQDFKVFIVDDVSTDGITTEILNNIKYPKAKVFFGKSNMGVGELARIYLKKLNTEFVFVFCADDKIEPDYIKSCVEYLDNNPKCGAVATWIKYFGAKSGIMKVDQNKAKLPDMLIENLFLGSSLVRYKAMGDVNFGNKEKVFQKHNDYDRWVSILEKGWSLGVIKKPLFLYRQIDTSLSHSINLEEELAFRKAFINKHRALFEKYVDYISLDCYRKLAENWNWQKEIIEGKDWLENQYNNLLIENSRLKQKINKFDIRKNIKRIINKTKK